MFLTKGRTINDRGGGAWAENLPLVHEPDHFSVPKGGTNFPGQPAGQFFFLDFARASPGLLMVLP